VAVYKKECPKQPVLLRCCFLLQLKWIQWRWNSVAFLKRQAKNNEMVAPKDEKTSYHEIEGRVCDIPAHINSPGLA
jgi:hypothetical protein